MPPMATNYASPDGQVTDTLIRYYSERSAGGVGLVIVEFAYVDPSGKCNPTQLGIYDDKLIPGLSRLADAIRFGGSKAAIQIHHAGRQTTSRVVGSQPVAPSRVPTAYSPMPIDIEMPRKLNLGEISALVQSFAEAARRAKDAGFDAVELHAAHGYLLNQFVSPYSNKRSDKYGGNINGRTRFIREVVESIRSKCGRDLAIIVRLSANEFVEGGIRTEDAVEISRKLEEYGIDAIHVSAGIYETFEKIVQPMYYDRGFLVPYAEAIKRRTTVPIIAVGRINDPYLAEKILEEKKADMIAMGRALIADPELPNKLQRGSPEDVRRCIACLDGCIARVLANRTLMCTVNPAVGRWDVLRRRNGPVERKKIAVIGAGPAGLEAARAAAVKGHEVTIIDRGGDVGGTVNIASIPEFKSELRELSSWYRKQLSKLRVEMLLNTEATPELVRALKPDAVVIATGSSPLVPDVPGADYAIRGDEALLKDHTSGKNVVVVGGGIEGCEIALYLSTSARRVILLEALDDIAVSAFCVNRAVIKEMLRERAVEVLIGMKVIEIRSNGAVATDKQGIQHFIEGESVVLACGRRSSNILLNELKNDFEVHIIGDALQPRKIIDAIHEGFSTMDRI